MACPPTWEIKPKSPSRRAQSPHTLTPLEVLLWSSFLSPTRGVFEDAPGFLPWAFFLPKLKDEVLVVFPRR